MTSDTPDLAIEPTALADRARPDGAGEPTVLVVDDEADITELYASWLADDYEVLTARNGGEALGRLTTAVDVVLLDRRMPDLSGDEVLSVIRDRGFDCRVAMVTAVEPDLDLIAMGFDDYLTKPVSAEDVQRVVGQLVGLQHQDDLLQEYFALASKIATLRSSDAAAELEANEEFEALLDRFDEVKVAARDHLAELMAEAEGDTVFRRLVGDWDAEADDGDVARS